MVTWTTGNVAEAFPGVFTTLGYTFIEEPLEMAFRKMFVRMGVFTAREIYLPDRAEDMCFTLFDGRAAANIDKFRDIAGLMPGTSASAVEQQLFGYVRPETVDDNSRRRYPAIAAKAPLLVATLPRVHDRMVVGLRSWRLGALARVEGLDRAGCLALLGDARERFEKIMILHLVVALVSSGLAERVSAALSRARSVGAGNRGALRRWRRRESGGRRSLGAGAGPDYVGRLYRSPRLSRTRRGSAFRRVMARGPVAGLGTAGRLPVDRRRRSAGTAAAQRPTAHGAAASNGAGEGRRAQVAAASAKRDDADDRALSGAA